MGEDAGINAAREANAGMKDASLNIRFGMNEASKNIEDGMAGASTNIQNGMKEASLNIHDGINEASKNIENGMEQIRYFGYATVNLLLENPWIRFLIIIECCYTVFKTLQIAEQLKFNWRSVLPIILLIIGLSIFWPSVRAIGILIVILTTVIFFIYKPSFSNSSLLQQFFSS